MAQAIELTTDLQQLATDIVTKASKAGATDAEVVIREGDEFSTTVRLGEVETLKESGSRGIGLRVFVGQRVASTSSSDFTPEGIEHLISGALALARVTSEDPFAGLADASEFGQLDHDLDLYHEDVYSLPTAERIDFARRCEAAAMSADTRIQNSDGGSFDAATGRKVFANSRGFVGEYRSSYCSVSTSPIAMCKNGEMQRDYWYSAARTLAKLDSPESVGAEAARRTLRRLDGRRVPTQRVPIVFAPEIARSLIGAIFDAANGDSIYRGASFFTGKLGEQVAAESINVIDDGTIVGGHGSSPFDGEGLPTRRKVIVENGVLKTYLLNTYTARKLNMQSTGNAVRGLAGNPGIGNGNLYLEAGKLSPEEILREIKTRLLRHRTAGPGRQHGHRRLLARSLRPLDRERRTDLSCAGDNRRRQSQGDVPQHHGHRQRPRLSGLRGLTYAAHRRHDHRWRIIRTSRMLVHSIAFDPTNPASALTQIPAQPGVFALFAADDRAEPYLSRTPNLKRRLTRFLDARPSQSKRLRLTEKIARIEYTLTGSDFESVLCLYAASMQVFGDATRKADASAPAIFSANDDRECLSTDICNQ